MLFTGIDHPAISCNDVRKLAEWYCVHLGMRIVADNAKTPPSLLLGFGEDNTSGMLELMPVKNPGPAPAEVPQFCPGIRHFAIRVSDFDKACQQLKDGGITFMSEPLTAIGGGKIISFRDAEGNEVQIVQR